MVSALLCYQDNIIGLRGKLHAYEALLYSILCSCKSPTVSFLNLNVHTVYPCVAAGSFLQLCMLLPPDLVLASVIEATSLPLLYVGRSI